MAFTNKEEMEICVCCGKITNIPKTKHVATRKNFVDGVGQLCEDCGYRLKREEENKRKNDMGV